MTEDRPEEKLGHKIKLINNAYGRAMNNSLAKWDITASQSFLLAYLEHCDRSPYQHDIEKQFNIKHPTATGILKRLAEKDYVTFIPDENDKRLKRIVITESGRNVSQSTKSSLDDLEATLSSALTEDEFKELNTLLDKLVVQAYDNFNHQRKDDDR